MFVAGVVACFSFCPSAGWRGGLKPISLNKWVWRKRGSVSHWLRDHIGMAVFRITNFLKHRCRCILGQPPIHIYVFIYAYMAGSTLPHRTHSLTDPPPLWDYFALPSST